MSPRRSLTMNVLPSRMLIVSLVISLRSPGVAVDACQSCPSPPPLRYGTSTAPLQPAAGGSVTPPPAGESVLHGHTRPGNQAGRRSRDRPFDCRIRSAVRLPVGEPGQSRRLRGLALRTALRRTLDFRAAARRGRGALV